jgi:hypothetical protein
VVPDGDGVVVVVDPDPETLELPHAASTIKRQETAKKEAARVIRVPNMLAPMLSTRPVLPHNRETVIANSRPMATRNPELLKPAPKAELLLFTGE